jgi:hypothetical protein
MPDLELCTGTDRRQSLDAQVKQLRAAGAEKVFWETARGARADRAHLRRVIGQLEIGDVLTVTQKNMRTATLCQE